MIKISVLFSNLMDLRLYRAGYVEYLKTGVEKAKKDIDILNGDCQKLQIENRELKENRQENLNKLLNMLQLKSEMELEISDLQKEVERLRYNARDNHGRLLRKINKK